MHFHIYDLAYMKINSITFFKMLADETRLALLVLLVRQAELCVCDLMKPLQLSQPKISRHLASLRESGLLIGRRQGQWVYYSLEKDLPEWMVNCLEQASNHYDGSFDLKLISDSMCDEIEE